MTPPQLLETPAEVLTPRLRLRPLRSDDAPALYPAFADTEAAWLTGREPYVRLEQMQEKVERDLSLVRAGQAISLAVTRREDPGDQLIGSIALFAWEPLARHLELGYILVRPEWGKGFVTECLPPVLDFAFHEVQAHRVEAQVDARNTASIRLLERAGFTREGAMREKCLDAAGVLADLLVYGLLHREWRRG